MPARRRPFRLAVLGLVAAALGLAIALTGLWVTLPDPSRLARENPRTTALIEQRRAEARARRRAFRPIQVWVPLDRVSPIFVRALLLSEDANFFGHDGIDWEAMRDAAEHDLQVGRFARGASTLTQQLAKNLWLGTERSLWRKAKEAILAAKLERALSKRRILALYVNVVEFDDAVFGIEAGARRRFGTSAAALTTAQSVVLASLLPAPRRVDLGHPSRWLKARARRLLDRLRDAGRLSDEEHLLASTELERILAGPAPADDLDEPPEDTAPRAASPDDAAGTAGAALARPAPAPTPGPVIAPLPATAPAPAGAPPPVSAEPATPPAADADAAASSLPAPGVPADPPVLERAATAADADRARR